jgi:hypothetical protein
LCWSNLFGWMSDLKMLETNQTKRIESQVTSHGENLTLEIKIAKLDGLNCRTWSQSALLSIKSIGKMGHLNGKIQEPKLDHSTYDKWEAENSTIISLLLH